VEPRDTVLAVSPHPDDELLGAGGTLLCLRAAGASVVNLACGLGRVADHARRRAELEDACARAGFELEIVEPPVAMSGGDDLRAAEDRIAGVVADALARLRPALVLSPSPSDLQRAHELVARAAIRAVERAAVTQRVAFWGLWASLPVTTTVVQLPAEALDRLTVALAAHRGELARAPYGDLVRARARGAAIVEFERALGFGLAHPGGELRYADALWELRFAPREGWSQALARVVPASELLAVDREWRPVGRPA
jgi:LmbE family N-acetylglucosaminyl deacetylase